MPTVCVGRRQRSGIAVKNSDAFIFTTLVRYKSNLRNVQFENLQMKTVKVGVCRDSGWLMAIDCG